jgi:D-3-phosphoglycerate dehydrogenase / 2-oxoglutarate reductase
MRILANDGISPTGINKLENAGYIVDLEKVDQNNLINEINLKNVEIVLVRSATTVRQEVIDNCPNLKLVGRGGVGMDNIDVDYAQKKGITVINTPLASSQSVAELVMGKLFSISRFLNESYKNLGNDNFSELKKSFGKGIELRGKTIGIIGFGRIGQSLASYALGCGMKVIAISKEKETIIIQLPDIQGLNSISTEIKVETNLLEHLPEMDFISLHVPKQTDGTAVFGAKEFEFMKNGVRIVNASRGGVIDEDALLTALDSGKVAAAGLDVYENEPHPRKEILNHPKIACTPHIGAATIEAQDRIGEELADLIIAKFGTFHNK